jgi:hypothetical protein
MQKAYTKSSDFDYEPSRAGIKAVATYPRLALVRRTALATSRRKAGADNSNETEIRRIAPDSLSATVLHLYSIGITTGEHFGGV